jgi:predicted GNAT family N-acyltransferase
VEEQQVSLDLEFDGLDASAVHWLAMDDQHRPIGCARMLEDGHFGRMAVLEAYRKKGVGRRIMLAAIDHARQAGHSQMFLHAQLTALPFYQGLGFDCYGDEFMDADMPHIAMRLAL